MKYIVGVSKQRKAILLTLLFGIPTIPLGMKIWPPVNPPLPDQIPFFIIASLFDAIGFGAGVAFLILTRKFFLESDDNKSMKLATYFSLSWLMISWWPHGHIHSTVRPGDFRAFITVEYVFHGISIIAAVVASYCIYHLLIANKRIAVK